MRSFALILAILVLSVPCARADAPATQPAKIATDIILHNLKDQAVAPLTLPAHHRAVVLLFICTDCPIANSYAPMIADLFRTYSAQRIDFYTVYEDAPLTTAAAISHHDAYNYPCDALLDQQHALAHAVGASVTPEAIVVGSGGEILYRGRIDDQYVSVGKKRYSATTHELKDVLSEIADNQPVTVESKPAIGCAIP